CFFWHYLVAGGLEHSAYDASTRQHRIAVGWFRTEDRAFRADNRSGTADWCAGGCVSASDARELVHAVVWCRLQLYPVLQAVIALELRVVRDRGAWIQVVRLVPQREHERAV